MEYCGDAEDYLFALEVFTNSAEDKARQIEDALANGDPGDYTLKLHSLKSTSGAIGAAKLSERAKALEAAGKAGDLDTIRRDTPALLRDYRELKAFC